MELPVDIKSLTISGDNKRFPISPEYQLEQSSPQHILDCIGLDWTDIYYSSLLKGVFLEVNKQNCRIWSEANPQVYVETPLHPEKLTVWCTLWAGGIIGPYFFKNDEGHNVTVNGDRYRAMITNFFIPELNNNDVQELWFQQDGATCHTARATIDLLKDTFGDRLISRFGPVSWPPRSCGLTPLDYFLCGYVKSLVYADKPQTLDHLEENLRRVIADIRPQMLEKVIENWTSRLDYIRASRGSHMPEIIFKMENTLEEGQGLPTSLPHPPTLREDLRLDDCLEYLHATKALYIYKHPHLLRYSNPGLTAQQSVSVANHYTGWPNSPRRQQPLCWRRTSNLNLGQVMKTTPELAPPFSNYHITSTGELCARQVCHRPVFNGTRIQTHDTPTTTL
ncbi:transposable element Tc3 transposase [Trichonephila clavipes]|uniref:Transposable element Tc3 transposase n=1 Tax=Trichonephila clavipes TaxID=2585209 RepID=A0A8X6S5L8_TRICX|nr:transposable element Tc3 transposase [Trichonephila clavipes]